MCGVLSCSVLASFAARGGGASAAVVVVRLIPPPWCRSHAREHASSSISSGRAGGDAHIHTPSSRSYLHTCKIGLFLCSLPQHPWLCPSSLPPPPPPRPRRHDDALHTTTLYTHARCPPSRPLYYASPADGRRRSMLVLHAEAPPLALARCACVVRYGWVCV